MGVLRTLWFGRSARWNELMDPLPASVMSRLRQEARRDACCAIDLGCGDEKFCPEAVGLDGRASVAADVVCCLESLPFRSGSVSVAVMRGTIEHVADPLRVLSEVRRVLRPGGTLYIDAPFLCRRHDCPVDYWRWTQSGFRRMLEREFEVRQFGILAGPGSALSELLRQHIAMLVTLPRPSCYATVYRRFAGHLTWPVKFLDRVLNRHPEANRTAFGFFALCQPIRADSTL